MEPRLLMEAMKASIFEVLETMFFMAIDNVTDGEKKKPLPSGNDVLGVKLYFNGPVCGCFRLMIPSLLAHAISADFLGVDNAALTEDDVHQTLMEMVNMLAGNTLSYYDADMVFDLSIPRIIGEDSVAGNHSGRAGHCGLDIQTLSQHMIMTAEFDSTDLCIGHKEGVG